MRGLIERFGGIAIIAPSMREIPLEQNPEAFTFAERLFAGTIQTVILLTGVGTRALADAVASRYDREKFLAALQNCTLIVRGPKPAAVLREWKVPFQFQVPEPNTWRDLLALVDAQVPVAGTAVAVQEYGQPNPDLYAGLADRGAEVVRVPVYRWELPDDTGPLLAAIRATIAGEVDVLMFTSAHQLHNVLAVAGSAGLRDAWMAAANNCVVASIGPTASETLEFAGLGVNIQPEHPKMGHLVVETAKSARAVLHSKCRR